MTIEALLGDILAEIRGMRDTMDRQAAPVAPVTPGNVPAAPSVPSTVAVVPPPTAPEGPTDISPDPKSVFGQAAQTTVPVAPPAAPTTGSPVATGDTGVELDKHGLPWDGRIHASSKAKIADGSWRQKRGVDPELVKTVEDELRKTMAAPAAPGEAWVPPAASPLSDMPWPIPEQSPAITYGEFAQTLMAGVAAGQVTILQVDAACQKHGVASFPALGNRPDLIPVIMQELGL